MSETTIVAPSRAPVGREPQLLGVAYVEPRDLPSANQRYRTEAWRLTNGETVVIVSDNGGTSLMNGSERIAAAIDDHWHKAGGGLLVIIEDWSEERPYATGERFRISTRDGASKPVDFDEWEAQGLMIPRP